MDLNKNISIWRGNTTPPTSNHLWQKDGKLYHYDGTSWKENEVDLSTEENDGLMSKEDKAKLDSYEVVTDAEIESLFTKVAESTTVQRQTSWQKL